MAPGTHRTMIDEQALRGGLQELASREVQERLWVQGNGDEMSSFTEAICSVFDDAGVSRAMDSGVLQTYFSPEFCSKMRDLDRLVGVVPEDAAPEEVIASPEMERIRTLARRLLEILDEQQVV